MSDTSSFDELLRLAKNDTTRARYSALWSLSQLAQTKQLSLENLVNLKEFFTLLIDSPDPDMAGSGCSGIAGIAKVGVADLHDLLPRIQDLMNHSDTGLCHSAAYAIAAIADASDLSLLVAMATNPDANLRASAASGLGRLQDVGNIPLLVKLLTDQDIRVQGVAMSVLGNQFDSALVEKELIHAIQTVDEPQAVRLIYRFGNETRNASKIATTGHHKSFYERVAIQSAVQDRALALIQSPQPKSRATACSVLGKLPDQRAVDRCIELLNNKDEDPSVKASACHVLQALPDYRALQPCLELLKDDDPDVRASACAVLQKLPDESAIVPGLKLLKDDNPGVRACACGLATALPLPDRLRAPVLGKLREIQDNPSEDVRVVRSARFAIRALESL
jgi:HEAT repeat protein